MGSMYSAFLFLGIQNASSVQLVVAVERTVFDRERAAGMYSPLAYICSGFGGNSIHICASCGIWCYSIFNDWILKDSSKILVILILHVRHFIILHILWHNYIEN